MLKHQVILAIILFALFSCSQEKVITQAEITAESGSETKGTPNEIKETKHCVSPNFKYTKITSLPEQAYRSSIRNFMNSQMIDKHEKISFLNMIDIKFEQFAPDYLIDYQPREKSSEHYISIIAEYKNANTSKFSERLQDLPEPELNVFYAATLMNLSTEKIQTLLDKISNTDIHGTLKSKSLHLGDFAEVEENLLTVAVSTANSSLLRFWHSKQLNFIHNPEYPLYYYVVRAAKKGHQENIEQLIETLTDLGQFPDDYSLFYLRKLRPDLSAYLERKFSYSIPETKDDPKLSPEFLQLLKDYKHLTLTPELNCSSAEQKPLTDQQLENTLAAFEVSKIIPHNFRPIDKERIRLLFPSQTITNTETDEQLYQIIEDLYVTDKANHISYIKSIPTIVNFRDGYSRDIRYYAVLLQLTDVLQYLSDQQLPKYQDTQGPKLEEVAELYYPNNVQLKSLASAVQKDQ